jgi:hypothetical protein
LRNAAGLRSETFRRKDAEQGEYDLSFAAHLEERAAARTREAEQLPLGEARQHALNNAAQLRSYAMRACGSKYDLNQDQPL